MIGYPASRHSWNELMTGDIFLISKGYSNIATNISKASIQIICARESLDISGENR